MSSQPDPTDRFVGQAIKSRRRQAGLTQKDLASAIGVGFQQVQKYERGDNRVSASVIARIAATLSCGVAEFFPGSSQADPVQTSRPRDEAEILLLYRGLASTRKVLLLDIARQFAALERQSAVD